MTEEISSAAYGPAAARQVAGYQIEAEIGRGGMATVYRARDIKLGRPVAVKILAPRLAQDETFRRRFIHESRAAAAVDHPHIVPVFEAGESGGVLFIAMRYVGDGDVRTLLERLGSLPVARTVAIAAQVASAADAAHARGLVHRDIKPANILLAETADGRADHVYLSDFGLSKDALAPTGLTSTGQFMGTLDYVAPEQIEGRSVDGRADQYALACTTVEMLTGAPPFRRDENLALMWAQLSEPPPPICQRRPDLPPAIDPVIGRALAKSPGDRYQTCREFAAALAAACVQQPAPRHSSPRHTASVPAEDDAVWSSLYGPPVNHAASAGVAGPGQPQAEPDRFPAEAAWPPAEAVLPPAAPDWPRAEAAWPPETAPPASSQPPPRRGSRAGLAIVAGVIVLICLAGLGYRLLGQHSPPAQAASGTTAPGTARAKAPALIVRAYFRAINQHRYFRAWRLGGSNNSSSYLSFRSGFAGTAHDAVRILSTRGNVVTVRLTATQTDGTVRVFQGTYAVGHGQIMHSDISRAS